MEVGQPRPNARQEGETGVGDGGEVPDFPLVRVGSKTDQRRRAGRQVVDWQVLDMVAIRPARSGWSGKTLARRRRCGGLFSEWAATSRKMSQVRHAARAGGERFKSSSRSVKVRPGVCRWTRSLGLVGLGWRDFLKLNMAESLHERFMGGRDTETPRPRLKYGATFRRVECIGMWMKCRVF